MSHVNKIIKPLSLFNIPNKQEIKKRNIFLFLLEYKAKPKKNVSKIE
jgi:hypothetical protein